MVGAHPHSPAGFWSWTDEAIVAPTGTPRKARQAYRTVHRMLVPFFLAAARLLHGVI